MSDTIDLGTLQHDASVVRTVKPDNAGVTRLYELGGPSYKAYVGDPPNPFGDTATAMVTGAPPDTSLEEAYRRSQAKAVVPPRNGIVTALDYLEKLVTTLEESHGKLISHLEPVLTPEATVNGGGPAGGDPSAISELTARIAAVATRISAAAAGINELTRRVDL